MAAIIACKVCGQVHRMDQGGAAPGMRAMCVRCGSAIERRSKGSLQITAAFTIAALLLYVPANLFPILHLDLYGATQDSTVWEGCVRFWQAGDYVIATIVFLASIFIPLLKLLGLFFLVATTQLRWRAGKMLRTWMYRVIESIGLPYEVQGHDIVIGTSIGIVLSEPGVVGGFQGIYGVFLVKPMVAKLVVKPWTAGLFWV